MTLPPANEAPGTKPEITIDVEWETTMVVHGEPAPQGSKRHLGNGILTESSSRVKPWREAVKYACLDDRTTNRVGPLAVEITFTVRKPRSAPKKKTTWPTRRPDVDKLLRSTLDGIGEAGFWRDDSQVVEVTGRKVYPDEGIDALPHPGALIRIRNLEA